VNHFHLKLINGIWIDLIKNEKKKLNKKELSMFTIWNVIIFYFFTFEDVEYQQTPSYIVDDTTDHQPFPGRLGNGVVHLL
jgi:hypothetical protein